MLKQQVLKNASGQSEGVKPHTHAQIAYQSVYESTYFCICMCVCSMIQQSLLQSNWEIFE